MSGAPESICAAKIAIFCKIGIPGLFFRSAVVAGPGRTAIQSVCRILLTVRSLSAPS